MSEAPLKPPGSQAFGFLIVTVTLDMIAGAMVTPIFPSLVRELAGGDPVAGARWLGVLITAWAAMQVIFSPILGALSDRYGRRPILLLSLASLAVSTLGMALAPNLAWLLVARLVSGAASSTMPVANAYIADVTPADDRARRFGYMSAAWGVGFVLGPAFGGLVGALGPRAPLYVAAALAAANTIWGLIALPESLPKAARAPFKVAQINPFSSVSFFWSKPGLLALGGIVFLTGLAGQVLGAASILYVEHRYDFSITLVGVWMAMIGAGYIVIQSLVVGPFVKRFGEAGAIYTGILVTVAAYLIYALSPWGWLFLAGTLPFVFGGLQGPGMNGMLSRSVGPDVQGQLQGARFGLTGISQLLGPLIFTELFARSIGAWSGWLPVGSVWLLAAALLVAAFVLARVALGRPGLSQESAGVAQ